MTQPDKYRLTPRQIRVVRLHLAGYTLREIAKKLSKGGKSITHQSVHETLQVPKVKAAIEQALTEPLAVERARIREKIPTVLERIEAGVLARGTVDTDPKGRRYIVPSEDELSPAQLKGAEMLLKLVGYDVGPKDAPPLQDEDILRGLETLRETRPELLERAGLALKEPG